MKIRQYSATKFKEELDLLTKEHNILLEKQRGYIMENSAEFGFKKRLYGYIIEWECSTSYIDSEGVLVNSAIWPIWSMRIYDRKWVALQAIDNIKKSNSKLKNFRLKPLYEFVKISTI